MFSRVFPLLSIPQLIYGDARNDRTGRMLEIGRKINKSYLIKRLIMGYFAIKSVNPIIFFVLIQVFPTS